MKRIALFVIIAVFFITGLYAGKISLVQSGKTKLQYFQYGGYSDTIYSMVYGQVFEKPGDELIPIGSYTATDHTNDGVHTITADSNGRIALAFCSGRFDIAIHKEGYTTLVLKHFQSRPDQVSSFSAILEKGDGEKEIDVSAPVAGNN